MMPVAKERFERLAAGSEGTMTTVTGSPQLELKSSMWRGRRGLSRPDWTGLDRQ